MRVSSDLKIPLFRLPLWILTSLLIAFLSLPSVYILLWSIKGTSNIGEFGAASSRWYSAVFHSPDWIYAIIYSIIVAVVSSSIAVISTLLYFYFSMWHRRAYQSLGFLLLLGPLFFPTIVYALALKIAFNSLGFPEWLPLTIGHTILMFPVLYFLFESSNEFIKIEWVFSAVTMGASHTETILKVFGPLLKRQIITAFGIGLLLSFDEIVVASTIIDGARVTVPKKMWDVVNRDMDPTPAVIATLVLGTTILAIAVLRIVRQIRNRH